MNKQYLKSNLKIGLMFFCLLLLEGYIAEWAGIIASFGPIFKGTLAVYFLGSLYLNRKLFDNMSSVMRYMLIIILSGLFTSLFGFLSLVFFVNLHLAAGGILL